MIKLGSAQSVVIHQHCTFREMVNKIAHVHVKIHKCHVDLVDQLFECFAFIICDVTILIKPVQHINEPRTFVF